MRILVVDDDIAFVEFLTLMIKDTGHQVIDVVTTGGPDVLAAYDKHLPDAALIDFVMPSENGINAARQILDKYPDASVVIVSGLPDIEMLRKVAKEAGALDAFKKPFSQTEFRDILSVLRFAPQHFRAEPNITPSCLQTVRQLKEKCPA